MPRSKKTWILVADGSRARYLVKEGPTKSLTVIDEEDWPAARAPTTALGADRPGRGKESASTTRHAIQPKADWHQLEKEKFAGIVARTLDAAAKRRQFDALVLVAPTRTLGQIERRLTAATRGRIIGKLAKDLTHTPIAELATHLRQVGHI